jgi:hypothetical protein
VPPKPKKSASKAVKSIAQIEAEMEALEDQMREAEAREREAAKPKLTPEQQRLQKERDALYRKNKPAIDRELENCTGHLRKLDIPVALEAIQRLKDYYLKHRGG